MKKKRVCIDINSIVPLSHRGYLSGVGRTTLELVEAFAAIKEELPFELILYTQNIKGVTAKTFNLPFESKHIYLRNKPEYSKVIQFLRLKEILINYDLFHIPHNFGYTARPDKTVLTIHDAMFFSYSESFLGHDFARENYPQLAKKCKGIVTCSESSKRDIVEYMNVAEEKVTVIPWGVSDKQFFPESEEIIKQVCQKYEIRNNYFIMASCDIGRKNTELLMENYRNYIREKGQYDLVLIWKNPPTRLLEKYKEEIENKHIHFVGGISDADLRALYSGAIASFFPSKYEGFGLPILESLACGTSIVTCRNSSLPEIGKETAFYVSEDSSTEMADLMLEFERGKYDLKEQKSKALKHVQKYSWKNAAEAYIQFYMKYL